MSKQPPYSVVADATYDTYPDGVRVTIRAGAWTRLKCGLSLVWTGSFITLGTRHINYPDKSEE
jgi:hypothetical protein